MAAFRLKFYKLHPFCFSTPDTQYLLIDYNILIRWITQMRNECYYANCDEESCNDFFVNVDLWNVDTLLVFLLVRGDCLYLIISTWHLTAMETSTQTTPQVQIDPCLKTVLTYFFLANIYWSYCRTIYKTDGLTSPLVACSTLKKYYILLVRATRYQIKDYTYLKRKE